MGPPVLQGWGSELHTFQVKFLEKKVANVQEENASLSAQVPHVPTCMSHNQ